MSRVTPLSSPRSREPTSTDTTHSCPVESSTPPELIAAGYRPNDAAWREEAIKACFREGIPGKAGISLEWLSHHPMQQSLHEFASLPVADLAVPSMHFSVDVIGPLSQWLPTRKLQVPIRIKLAGSLGSGCREALASLLAQPHLIALNLSQSFMSASDKQALCEMLETNSTLEELVLPAVNVAWFGPAVARMLQANTTLRLLGLAGIPCIAECSLGLECVRVIAEALERNSSLHALDLRASLRGHAGVKSLATMLATNTTLVDLNLRAADIVGNVHLLCDALVSNTTLERLDVGGIAFSDADAESLVAMLKENRTIRHLDVSGCYGLAYTSFYKGLAVNTGLRSLTIDNLCDRSLAGLVALLDNPLSPIESIELTRASLSKKQLSLLTQAVQKSMTLVRFEAPGQPVDDLASIHLATARNDARRKLLVKLAGPAVISLHAEARGDFNTLPADCATAMNDAFAAIGDVPAMLNTHWAGTVGKKR